jgi:hypothetical protein
MVVTTKESCQTETVRAATAQGNIVTSGTETCKSALISLFLVYLVTVFQQTWLYDVKRDGNMIMNVQLIMI